MLFFSSCQFTRCSKTWTKGVFTTECLLLLHEIMGISFNFHVFFFQLVSVYEVLKDPDKRRIYNRVLVTFTWNNNISLNFYVFFQLVSVYEVLKDPDKRRIYNRVLVEGPPDWRSAIYYYRRARKMSLMEIALILTVVVSVAQYFMAWGAYWDKWRTLVSLLLHGKDYCITGHANPISSAVGFR